MRIPQERGGWWHEYVCPAHGVELLHDGLLTGSFPVGGARCPYGCQVDTPAVRGAWTVLAHQACAVAIRDLALADDPDGHAQAAALLAEAAALYGSLAGEHGGSHSWMLRGRLFHQALTEAIWAVHLGRAVWALRDRGVSLDGGVDAMLDSLVEAARQGRETLLEQGKFTSNYLAWLDAAGAVCSRDPEWLTGEHGIHAHILAATLADGWQWEASTYYHSFVLRACLLAIDGIPGVATPPEVADRLTAMRQVLLDLRPDNGELPSFHDGPYRRPGYDAELAELGLAPADLDTADASAGLLDQRGSSSERSERVEAPVIVHPDGGYAIVRAHGLTATLAFGPHGGSHGHYDKLSLSLYGKEVSWQVDPGQVPYGHRGWRRHFASTAAHPTFSVDGLDQAECSGSLVSYDDHSVTVACDAAYPGVTATRTLRITDDGLVDEVTVRSEVPRRIALHLRPSTDCQVVPEADGFATRWSSSEHAESLQGRHSAGGATAILARSGPGTADDPQRPLIHIDWIAEDCTEVTFSSTFVA